LSSGYRIFYNSGLAKITEFYFTAKICSNEWGRESFVVDKRAAMRTKWTVVIGRLRNCPNLVSPISPKHTPICKKVLIQKLPCLRNSVSSDFDRTDHLLTLISFAKASHLAEVIANHVINLLYESGLSVKSVMCIVRDTGSNMVKACNDLGILPYVGGGIKSLLICFKCVPYFL
jgi:hypothetical protein